MKRGDIVTVAAQGDYGKPRGRLDESKLIALNHMLSVVIGIAD